MLSAIVRKILRKINHITQPYGFTYTNQFFDVGYYRLDFNQFKYLHANEKNCDVLDQKLLAHQWTNLFDQGDYKELLKNIMANVNLRVISSDHQEYFKPYAIYCMACFFAAINNAEKAKYFCSKIEFNALSDGTDFLPSSIVQVGQFISYRQILAIRKGMPSIAIISLPKSASAFLTTALSNILDMPVMRISIGEGFESYPVPKWIAQFARGGAVIHEHINGTLDNLHELKLAGIKTLWLQVRDPRDALFSASMSDDGKSFNIDFVKHSIDYAAWIDRWITIAKNNEFGIEIHFITYQDVTRNFKKTIEMILAKHMNVSIKNRIKKYIEQANHAVIPNFRKGISGDWRSVIDIQDQKKAWDGIPLQVKELLAMTY